MQFFILNFKAVVSFVGTAAFLFFLAHPQTAGKKSKRFHAEILRTSEIRKFEALKEVLKATEEQWMIIKPKLEEIDRLMSESDISVKIGSE